MRERFAEEAPRVAIVLDRRPSMAIYPAPSPWLDKPRAVATAVRAIVESADDARATLELVAGPERARDIWQPVRGRASLVRARAEQARFDARRGRARHGDQRASRNGASASRPAASSS